MDFPTEQHFRRNIDSYGSEYFKKIVSRLPQIKEHFKYPEHADHDMREVIDRLYMAAIVQYFNLFLNECLDEYLNDDYQSILEKWDLYGKDDHLLYVAGWQEIELDFSGDIKASSVFGSLIFDVYLEEASRILKMTYIGSGELLLDTIALENGHLPHGFNELAYMDNYSFGKIWS